MLSALFTNPNPLLQHGVHRASADDQLRVKYLALTLAVAAVILALVIVASVGGRLW